MQVIEMITGGFLGHFSQRVESVSRKRRYIIFFIKGCDELIFLKASVRVFTLFVLHFTVIAKSTLHLRALLYNCLTYLMHN